MPRQEIATPAAPGAIGPYSQAIDADGFIFFSGQLGVDPETHNLLEGIDNQTERALLNMAAVLAAAGLTMADVVKCTVFMADLSMFATMNKIYATHFSAPEPARSTVQVAALPMGALVEIEAIARRSR
jgi:2-iminobutanoate/2-iminopropanoate deaminase